MSRSKVILFTSTGRPCRYVISLLLDSRECPEIRVITRSGSNIRDSFPPKLQVSPHSIVVVDHYESKEYKLAFRGVDIVFNDGLLINVKEEAAGAATIDAAKEANVQHFILLSVLQPMRTKLQTHFSKLSIEEYLLESRLNYTILQPSHYMQNVDLPLAVRTGKFSIGFSSSIPHGFVDLLDLAAVALKVINNPAEHNLARYELVAQNISYDKIAETISKVSGKAIRCQVLEAKEYLALMNQGGEIRNEYAEDAILRLMIYYDRWGLTGNSNMLKWLLGRTPTNWETYLRRELGK